MIALIVGDEAVLLGYGLALRLPDAEIREGPVDKDDGPPGALFAVGELDAVHPQVPQQRGVIGPRLPGEATPEHHATLSWARGARLKAGLPESEFAELSGAFVVTFRQSNSRGNTTQDGPQWAPDRCRP